MSFTLIYPQICDICSAYVDEMQQVHSAIGYPYPWLLCPSRLVTHPILGYLASSLLYSLTETFTSSVPCHFCAIPGGTGIFVKAAYGPTCLGNAQPLLFQVRLFSVGMASKGTRHVCLKSNQTHISPLLFPISTLPYFSQIPANLLKSCSRVVNSIISWMGFGCAPDARKTWWQTAWNEREERGT